MLAICLEGLVSSLIHMDQVGFVTGITNNMRPFFHIISRAESIQHPAVAISPFKNKTSLSSLWCLLLTRNRYIMVDNKWRNSNPLILHSCDLAKNYHRRFSISSLSLPSCPIWKNPLFTGGWIFNKIWQGEKSRAKLY